MSGNANRFSWLYRPGATKAHIWYISQGSANRIAAIISTFKGTKKGENTPTAMSRESGGMWARMGTAIRSIRPLGPGQKASAIMHSATPAML